ncbi:hypothetical protein HMPREF9176_0286 [Streptococcus downei F0415]|nr:hypothetical protein HMPREF9176_0286 [Streptococcus downei F0415]
MRHLVAQQTASHPCWGKTTKVLTAVKALLPYFQTAISIAIA